MVMEMLGILRGMLVGDRAERIVLNGGLLVEYVPAGFNTCHTLRIARQKHMPGDHELVSVRLRVLAAGRMVGLPVDEESWKFNGYAERVGSETAWHGYEIHWQTARPQWVQGALL